MSRPRVERPPCLTCGKPLRRYGARNSPNINPPGSKQWGDYGDNAFCGLSCGYWFAVHAIRRSSAKTRSG